MLEGSQGKLGGLRATKAETIPPHRLFLMGGGKPVQPSRCETFLDEAVSDALDLDSEMHAWFQLGFAAAVDMISRGTLDFTDHALNVIDQAWSDVNNITKEPNFFTDIMRMVGE